MSDTTAKRLPRATTLEEIMALIAAPTAPESLECRTDRRPIQLPRVAPLIVVNDANLETEAMRH